MNSTTGGTHVTERSGRSLTYYCWHCYGEAGEPAGPCPQCGQEIGAPEEADYTAHLVWALGHPLPDRRVLAAQVLGQRGDRRAAAALRDLVHDDDPYVAAVTLEALALIDDPEEVRALAADLASGGSAPVRAVVRRLLDPGD